MQKSKSPQRSSKPTVRRQAHAAKAEDTREKNVRERRKKSSERRHSDTVTQFPIITTQGICVRKERRKIPERRTSNIVVKETVMNEEVFETLFSGYLAYRDRLLLIKKLNR